MISIKTKTNLSLDLQYLTGEYVLFISFTIRMFLAERNDKNGKCVTDFKMKNRDNIEVNKKLQDFFFAVSCVLNYIQKIVKLLKNIPNNIKDIFITKLRKHRNASNGITVT